MKIAVNSLPMLMLIMAISNAKVAFAEDAAGFRDGHREALGPLFEAAPNFRAGARHESRTGTYSVRHWNEIAINGSGLDHTPVAPGENRVFGEQLGPGRSSRAMAIVHIAIFDAVNAIVGGYRSYTGIRAAPDGVSMNAAVCQAAHDALAALFPSQAASFDQVLAEDLGRIPPGTAKLSGIDLGRRAATAILALRADDGSQHAEPRVGIDHTTSDLPGRWGRIQSV
jgi:hypothetical protein